METRQYITRMPVASGGGWRPSPLSAMPKKRDWTDEDFQESRRRYGAYLAQEIDFNQRHGSHLTDEDVRIRAEERLRQDGLPTAQESQLRADLDSINLSGYERFGVRAHRAQLATINSLRKRSNMTGLYTDALEAAADKATQESSGVLEDFVSEGAGMVTDPVWLATYGAGRVLQAGKYASMAPWKKEIVKDVVAGVPADFGTSMIQTGGDVQQSLSNTGTGAAFAVGGGIVLRGLAKALRVASPNITPEKIRADATKALLRDPEAISEINRLRGTGLSAREAEQTVLSGLDDQLTRALDPEQGTVRGLLDAKRQGMQTYDQYVAKLQEASDAETRGLMAQINESIYDVDYQRAGTRVAEDMNNQRILRSELDARKADAETDQFVYDAQREGRIAQRQADEAAWIEQEAIQNQVLGDMGVAMYGVRKEAGKQADLLNKANDIDAEVPSTQVDKFNARAEKTRQLREGPRVEPEQPGPRPEVQDEAILRETGYETREKALQDDVIQGEVDQLVGTGQYTREQAEDMALYGTIPELDTPAPRVEADTPTRPVEGASGEQAIDFGNPRHTETPEFKRFFGDWQGDAANASKVVDEAGEPLVVHHGTRHNVNSFDLSKAGQSVDSGWYGTGSYHSPDTELTGRYSLNKSGLGMKEKMLLPPRGDESAPIGARTISSYISLKNPKILRYGDRGPSGSVKHDRFRKEYGHPETKTESDRLRERLLSEGHDGVIVYSHDGSITEVVAFHPDRQVKSVNNRGTWNPNDPNMLRSGIAPDDIAAMVSDALAAGKWTAKQAIIGARWALEVGGDAIKTMRDFAGVMLDKFGRGIRKHIPEMWQKFKQFRERRAAMRQQTARRRQFGGIDLRSYPDYPAPDTPASSKHGFKVNHDDTAVDALGAVAALPEGQFPEAKMAKAILEQMDDAAKDRAARVRLHTKSEPERMGTAGEVTFNSDGSPKQMRLYSGRNEPRIVLHEATHVVLGQHIETGTERYIGRGLAGSVSGSEYISGLRRLAESDHPASGVASVYLEYLEKTGRANNPVGIGVEPLSQIARERAGIRYGDSNLHEFVAEATSNPEFAAELNKIVIGGKGLFDRMIAAVKRALGFRPKEGSALDRAFNEMFTLLNKEPGTVQFRGFGKDPSYTPPTLRAESSVPKTAREQIEVAQRKAIREQERAARGEREANRALADMGVKERLPMSERGKFLTRVRKAHTPNRVSKTLAQADRARAKLEKDLAIEKSRKELLKQIKGRKDSPIRIAAQNSEFADDFNRIHALGVKDPRKGPTLGELRRMDDGQRAAVVRAYADIEAKFLKSRADVHVGEEVTDAARGIAKEVNGLGRKEMKVTDGATGERNASLLKQVGREESLQPERLVERLGKRAMAEIYNPIAESKGNYYKTVKSFNEELTARLKQAGIADPENGKWLNSVSGPRANKRTVKLDGQDVTFTDGQFWSLLANLTDPQTRKLVEGGAPISLANDTTRRFKIDEDGLRTILASSTEQDRAVVKAIKEVYNGTSKDRLNKTWRELFGKDLATHDDYFPRMRDVEKTIDDIEEVMRPAQDGTLEGRSLAKERTENPDAPVVIGDILSTSDKHFAQVSAIVEMAPSVRKVRAILGNREFKDATVRSYGDSMHRAIDTWVQDVIEEAGGFRRPMTPTQVTLGKLVSNTAVGVLGVNPWVILKQLPSFGNAMTEIDPRYMLQGAKDAIMLEPRAVRDRMFEHSPQIWARYKVHASRLIGDMRNATPIQRTSKDLSDKLMAGISWADQNVIASIWRASELKVKAEQPNLKGDDYWKAVNDQADRVIRRTQPNFDSVNTSSIQRKGKGDPFMKAASMFMSQRNTNYNMLYSALASKDPKKIAAILGVVAIAQPLMISGVDETRDWMYGRQEHESGGDLALSLATDVVANNFSQVYFAGPILDPATRGVSNAISGKNNYIFPPSNPITSTANGIQEGIAKLLDGTIDGDGERAWDGFERAMLSAAALGGVPIRSPYRFAEELIERYNEADQED